MADLYAELQSIPASEICCEPLCTAYWSRHPNSHHHTGTPPTAHGQRTAQKMLQVIRDLKPLLKTVLSPGQYNEC